MPSDHRSEAASPSSPRTRSGAMYSGEPISTPVAVSPVESWSAAMPKSVSTADPSGRSNTLAGFTSRWRIPSACAARSADSTSRPRRTTSAGGMGPDSRRSCREPPRTISMTIHGCPSVPAAGSTMWWIVTTWGWARRARARASRTARSRIWSARPGWAAAVAGSGGRTSLSATSRCRAMSRARHTVPMPPLPSGATSSKRPSISCLPASLVSMAAHRRGRPAQQCRRSTVSVP